MHLLVFQIESKQTNKQAIAVLCLSAKDMRKKYIKKGSSPAALVGLKNVICSGKYSVRKVFLEEIEK